MTRDLFSNLHIKMMFEKKKSFNFVECRGEKKVCRVGNEVSVFSKVQCLDSINSMYVFQRSPFT